MIWFGFYVLVVCQYCWVCLVHWYFFGLCNTSTFLELVGSLWQRSKNKFVSISLLCSKLDTGTGKVIKFINFSFMFGRTDYSHCSLIHTYTPAATWSSMPYTSGGKSCMYKSSYKRGYCFQAIEAFGEPCVCDHVLVLLTMFTLTVSFIIDELQMWRKFSE